MARPRLNRRVLFSPRSNFFKPQGIPMNELEVVELSLEEMEALRLKSVESLDQKCCAEQMKTSTSTFQRILCSAIKKVSIALVKGQAIKISK